MLVKRSLLLAAGVALAFAWGGQNANAQGVFTIKSSSFKDGERLATKMAGNNKQNPNSSRVKSGHDAMTTRALQCPGSIS
jgi:hypothetical protein